jgi:hypothetical protein
MSNTETTLPRRWIRTIHTTLWNINCRYSWQHFYITSPTYPSHMVLDIQSFRKSCNHTSARIHSQFESLGFVGKYDQSPTKLVNSWTLKYGGADFLRNPRIFSLQKGLWIRANENVLQWSGFGCRWSGGGSITNCTFDSNGQVYLQLIFSNAAN